MAYLTVDQIDAAIDALATNSDYAGYLTVFNLNHTTADRNEHVKCLKIGKGSIPVVIVGGVHAREWAPPDSLVSFATKLLQAYHTNSPFIDPAFAVSSPDPDSNDPGYTGNITFDRATIPAADIRRIVDNLEIYIVPCVNRDGREFSQAASANKRWRANRRNHGGSCPDPPSPPIGVDLNRNFPVPWDMGTYYNAATQTRAHTATSDVLCDLSHRRKLYHGASPLSEPEAKNIQELVDEKKPRFYLDVHSHAREIYYPWGCNENQTTDSYKTFVNEKWDNVAANPAAQRGRPIGGTYQEYFPSTATVDLLAQHVLYCNQMKNSILGAAGSDSHARLRSDYQVKQSLSLYPTAGDSQDFVFSTQIERETTPSNPSQGHKALIKSDRFPVYSFTIESGHASDGEFWPSPAPNKRQFRKVQREIHFAVLGLLKSAAAWSPPTSTSSDPCFIATAVYGSDNHDFVAFLRAFRDYDMQGSPLASGLMSTLNRVYNRFSPQAAQFIRDRFRYRELARRFAVRPAVWLVKAFLQLTAPIQSPYWRANALAGLLMLFLLGGFLLLISGLLSTMLLLLKR